VSEDVESEMADYRFDAALRRLREFVWEDLADDYVELVKGRLYNGRPGERDAAEKTIYTAVTAVVRMLSPFSPHAAEEIWTSLPGTEGSVYSAAWPDVDLLDEDAEVAGRRIAETASEIRAWKSEQGMPLNADLDRIELYFDGDDSHLDTYDLSETVNAPIKLASGRPDIELVPVDVDGEDSKIGPEFRSDAGAVMAALDAADPAEIQAQIHLRGHRHGRVRRAGVRPRQRVAHCRRGVPRGLRRGGRRRRDVVRHRPRLRVTPDGE